MVDVNDLFDKKEYYNLINVVPTNKKIPFGFYDYEIIKTLETHTMNLQGHQIFVKNLFNPHTEYKRLLLYHSTGTGKTLAILSIAEQYIKYFKQMQQQPSFIIIGFTESIIIRELLKYPEFGYITDNEIEELEKLRNSNSEKDLLRRRGLKSVIKRRITDKVRGGYYKFYGYQKFANDIFNVTVKGLELGITINYLYEDESKFEKRIDEELAKETIVINRNLIESLKYSFIACDEIHNVYNAQSKNNRGMAIKYVIELLEKEDPTTSPKFIFASATPLTSSPTEIIDIMDLLIPKRLFKREDFFEKNGNLKHDSLERIGKICNGYVSFLKDTKVDDYPKRIFEGESIKYINYLKFIKCDMPPFLEKTLKEVKDTDNVQSLLATGNYTLYDITFPNPYDENIGLYQSSKIPTIINESSEEWKEKNNIYVKNNIIQGDILKYENIGKYSGKYKQLLKMLINLLNTKNSGKILIYHYFVGISGVLFIYEMLLNNGFLNETATPLSDTLCSICGTIQKDHEKKDHNFKPARVLITYGELSSELDRTLSLYNNNKNAYGNDYKILIGSRVIHEGVDFNCIRHMFVLSLPRDISTLIQVIGRAIRRKSHILLPKELREVYINILVSTFKNDNISPETLNYKRKMETYLKIQSIEKELRRYAVDNFINYNKMDIEKKDTIDGIPYEPVYKFKGIKDKKDNELTTFYAYGYSLVEEVQIINIIKKLFTYRPVWTADDLWKEILNPFPEIKTAYDHSTFSKENFYLSLDFLINSTYIENMNYLTLNQDVYNPYITISNEVRRLIYQDPYYILCPIDQFGIPVIDYGSYMRFGNIDMDIDISISNYIDTELNQRSFNIILKDYINNYKKNPILSIALLNPNFHYTICKQLIESKIYEGTEGLIDIYNQLNALIYYDDFISEEIAKSFNITQKSKPIGFRAQDISFIYVNNEWEKIITSLLSNKVYTEQEYVGFMKINSGVSEFKIRPGIPYLNISSDRRKMDRGRSCITLPRSNLTKISNFLDIHTSSYKNICDKILNKMLELQMKETIKNKPKRYFLFYFSIFPEY